MDFLIFRCYHAIDALALTNKTIDEIAEETGFSNRSHLTRIFKKWYNTSPAAYRKALQAEFGDSSLIRCYPFDMDKALTVINQYLDGVS